MVVIHGIETIAAKENFPPVRVTVSVRFSVRGLGLGGNFTWGQLS